MMRLLARHKFIFVIGILGSGLIISWLVVSPRGIKKKSGEDIGGESEEKVSVRVFEVKVLPFSDYLDVLGNVKGNNEIELKFPISGNLEKINFKEGDWVDRGSAIAELATEEARLKLEKAKIEFESAEKLYKLGAVLKDRLEEARIDFELAQQELKRHIIVSPFRGVVGEIEKETGEFVTPQDKIANFIDVSSVYLEIGIIEKEINKIKVGQSVEVQVDTYPEKIFEGDVTTIVPIISGTSRTMRVRIKVENPEGELLPGMFGRAKILIYDKANALVVPLTSIFQEGDNFFVFKVRDSKLTKSEVTVNYLDEEYAELIDGVREGDMVAIKVMGEMADGKRVEIID